MNWILGFLGGLIAAIRKAFVAGVVAVLLATNVLLVTSSQFFDLVSSIFDALPVNGLMANSPRHRHNKLKAEKADLESKRRQVRQRVAETSQRAKARAARAIARNAGTTLLQAIPLFGAGVAMADAALDVKDICGFLHDMSELESAVEGRASPDATGQICGYELSGREKIEPPQSAEPPVDFTVDDYTAHTARDATGETLAIAKENVERGWQDVKEVVGGTLAEVFD